MSYDIQWERFATTPREHQKDGVRALLRHPAFMLADEVGAGKSKQVIDTAQILQEAGDIDTGLVTCPAFARGVWANPDPALGEVAKHSWPSRPYTIVEYSVKNPRLPKILRPGMVWVVTNYEFIRRDERLLPLLNFLLRRRFMLVCDEAWALADYGTDQWKAVAKIRKLAQRVVLLNGTPVADSPLDLFAQMKLLREDIIGIKWFSHFRARYAILKPNVNFPLITGWQNLEELREKVSPYILRRRTRDCFDLPPVLEPVMIEAKLKDETWRIYKQMRDDMVAWIGSVPERSPEWGDGGSTLGSIAKQAFVRGLRLAQITSGFLGGVQEIDMDDAGMLDFGTHMDEDERIVDKPVTMTKEIGREKLDALMAWLAEIEQPERLLIWSRFRAEIERTCRAFNEAKAPIHRHMLMLYGQQSKSDRAAAIALLNPDIPVTEPSGVVGHPAAGGAALNLAGASMAVSLSQEFSLRVYLQKNGRIDRMGQRHPIRYVDVVATGPKGQRTIDHHVLAALRTKEDIANWTAATWRKKLMEE